jgi:drug/metabolite transporter (DMT)-like permease
VREGRLRAIASMLTAVVAFSGMDTLLKLLSTSYPPMQVTVLRGACSLPFMLVPVLVMGGWRSLRPRRLFMHLMRGALSVVVLGGFIIAVRELSLANAYAVFLSAPLIVTALAVPMLKERTATGNWIAIAVGLAGVLIMLRPSVSGFATLGALAALVSAIAYALSAVTLRMLTRTDTTGSVVVWTISVMTVLAGLIAAPHWVRIHPQHYPWLVVLGALAATGSYLLATAFRSAPASVVAPLEYTALLWGILIDRVVWNVLPSSRVCWGGAVVIASGLYLIWRERTHVAREVAAQSWQPLP